MQFFILELMAGISPVGLRSPSNFDVRRSVSDAPVHSSLISCRLRSRSGGRKRSVLRSEGTRQDNVQTLEFEAPMVTGIGCSGQHLAGRTETQAESAPSVERRPRPQHGQTWLQIVSSKSSAFDLAYALGDLFEEDQRCVA